MNRFSFPKKRTHVGLETTVHHLWDHSHLKERSLNLLHTLEKRSREALNGQRSRNKQGADFSTCMLISDRWRVRVKALHKRLCHKGATEGRGKASPGYPFPPYPSHSDCWRPHFLASLPPFDAVKSSGSFLLLPTENLLAHGWLNATARQVEDLFSVVGWNLEHWCTLGWGMTPFFLTFPGLHLKASVTIPLTTQFSVEAHKIQQIPFIYIIILSACYMLGLQKVISKEKIAHPST